MAIKVNLHVSENESAGNVQATVSQPAQPDLKAKTGVSDSYSAAGAAKDESDIFSWFKLFPMLGLISRPLPAGLEKLSLCELYERATLLSNTVRDRRNIGPELYAEMRLEQLQVEVEILFRHFSTAASYLATAKAKRAEVEVEKASFLMESMLAEFSTASKLMNIALGLNDLSINSSGRNIFNFSKAVMDFAIFVSNVSQSKTAFMMARENINNLISVLDSVSDIGKYEVLEALLAAYGWHFDEPMIEKIFEYTAKQQLEVSKTAILEFIRGELQKEGRSPEAIDLLLKEEEQNFKNIKAGRKNHDGGSNLFNDNTSSEPVFMFYSQALWRPIEIKPFYKQLVEGVVPPYGTLPVLHAPVAQFKKPASAAVDVSLYHLIGEAFTYRNEVLMKGLAELRESLKKCERERTERAVKK